MPGNSIKFNCVAMCGVCRTVALLSREVPSAGDWSELEWDGWWDVVWLRLGVA